MRKRSTLAKTANYCLVIAVCLFLALFGCNQEKEPTPTPTPKEITPGTTTPGTTKPGKDCSGFTATLASNDADNNVVVKTPVVFTATAAGATRYEFYVNDVVNQQGQSATFTLTPADVKTYNVYVKAINADTCVAQSAAIVLVSTEEPCRAIDNHSVTIVPSTGFVNVSGGKLINAGTQLSFNVVTSTGTAIEAKYIEFLINGTVVQKGASATYTTSTLAHLDKVEVKVARNEGCELKSLLSTVFYVRTTDVCGSSLDTKKWNSTDMNFRYNFTVQTNSWKLQNVTISQNAGTVTTPSWTTIGSVDYIFVDCNTLFFYGNNTTLKGLYTLSYLNNGKTLVLKSKDGSMADFTATLVE